MTVDPGHRAKLVKKTSSPANTTKEVIAEP